MHRPATQFLPRWLVLLSLLLSGCGAHMHHVVEPGETLYSIGFLYGYDYRTIARWNGIRPPYHLKAGQVLRVAPSASATPPAKPASPAPVRKPAPVVGPSRPAPRAVAKAQRPAAEPRGSPPAKARNEARSGPPGEPRNEVRSKTHNEGFVARPSWQWPVKERRVLRTFSANDPARKGIDIAGERGSPVYAAASGKVVYAGSGLVRYGQLIIVKHNEKYLSAYAHNDKLRVKEGDVVKVGQRIADLGSSGAQRPMLHFEIRRNGKPVNPLRYLPQH